MNQIKVLPDQLINKIAAGEVVERPASVVKELVENSLDAGSQRIEVDLEEGGKKSIRVYDDGFGIAANELNLAVSRHATSKILEVQDLESIGSFGFRGEALASIGSVSKLSLKSKQEGAPARQIIIEGGELIDESECAHPVGTTVSVKYLFFNTPARLKFLKTPETEMTHIMDYLTNAALANPQVSFKVTHNDKQVLFTDGRMDSRGLVAALFDEKVAEHCYEVDRTQGDLSLSALIGHPEISRSHSRDVHMFVNGRPVKDRMLLHAIVESYRDTLMRGRYPFAVLFLNLPGTMVDVNVHPAKTEVRFLNHQVIHRLVIDAFREKLVTQPWLKANADALGPRAREVESNVTSLFGSRESVQPMPTGANDNELISALKKSWNEAAPIQGVQPQPSMGVGPRKIAYRDIRIIGQFAATYIIGEAGDRLVMIDQHAAHERIHFEKLLLKYQEGGIPTQDLLIPLTFDLKPSQTEVLKCLLEDLKTFGYDIDFFGGNTFIVRSEPMLLSGKLSIHDMITDIVGDVLEKGRITSLKDQLHHVLATMACHGAIRANHRLDPEEMRALLFELDQYQLTSFCPHGRPAAVEMDKYEIERWFKRVL